MDNLSWLDEAACRFAPFGGPEGADINPEGLEVFFAGTDGYKNARRVCESCSVRRECLEWVLAAQSHPGQVAGYVAGFSASTRLGHTPEQLREMVEAGEYSGIVARPPRKPRLAAARESVLPNKRRG